MPETFLDSSPNALTVTANGNVAQGTFSPFTGNTTGHYSAFFDGTGDYLSVASSSMWDFGVDAFTIECWINRSGNGSNPASPSYENLLGNRPSDFSSGQFYIYITNTGVIGFQARTSSGDVVLTASSQLSVLSGWNHLSLVRSGNTFTIYLNGNSVATTTNSASIGSTSAVAIGAFTDATYTFKGYIADLRVVKGTAVYTANFTPPTSKLTAIANTSLLTLQDSTFIDNSTNAFTITRNGDVGIDSFSPYMLPGGIAATTEWSTAFDGTGDYLRTSSNAPMDFGSGAFTIEGWIKSSVKTISAGASRTIIGNSGNVYTLQLYINTSSGVLTFGNTGTTFIAGTSDVANNQWNHFAIVRENTSANGIKMYINGVLQATGTNSQNYTSGTIYIGASDTASGFWNGNISNLRIVKGSAVYTSNFTPSTTKLTAITNTALLTCQDASFRDNSSNNYTITKNGDAAASVLNPFPAGAVSSDNFDVLRGTWSGYFDGNGDYFQIAAGSAFQMGTGSFTMEFWINATSGGTGDRNVIDNWNTGGGTSFLIRISGGDTLQFITPPGTVSVDFYPYLNKWTHVAGVRDGTSFRMYVNGVSVGTPITSSTSLASLGPVRICGTEYVQGHLSNLRIVKGTALYTANFVPPTGRLNAVANTSLLTLQDNRFKDNSVYNHTITKNGDVAISTFSPFDNITSGLFSNYFDGTGDYLSVADSAAFTMGSENFSVECWVYSTKTGAIQYILGQVTSAGTAAATSFQMYKTSDNKIAGWVYAGSAKEAKSTVDLPLNTWTHVAMVRSGANLLIFMNGTQVASNATLSNTSITDSSGQFAIGRTGEYNANYFEGYVSNLRIVKGTALYTSAFTPSTTALTPVANTVLLACQSARLKDNGPLNHAITRNGDVKVSTFAPFPVLESYSKVLNGGSTYFDGTGDYLTTSSNAPMDFGSGAFTIEGWVNTTNKTISVGASRSIIGNSGNTYTMQLYINTSSGVLTFGKTGSTFIAGTTDIANGQWNHFAIVRQNTSTNGIKMYINGVLQATGTNSQNYTSGTIYIGASDTANGFWNGYIADLRITKGRAVYTTNFMPDRQPATPTGNTSLLLRGTNTSYNDYSSKSVIEPIGSITLNSTNKKFETNSIYTGTSGSNYLNIKDNGELLFGTGDFTVEGWFMPNSDKTTNLAFFYSKGINSATGLLLAVGASGCAFRAAGENDLLYAETISSSSFTHIAFVRSGTTRRIFVNGTQVASDTLSFSVTDTTSVNIGAIAGPASDTNKYHGYIDDLRITKTARYTSNFTAPTAAFGTKGE